MKIIKFASEESYIDLPKTAKSVIPNWYKLIKRFTTAEQKPKLLQGSPNTTVKTCVPFLDGLTTGYVVTLWQDLQVTQTEGGTLMEWAQKPDVVIFREDNGNNTIPTPSGHSSEHFAWACPIFIKTPKGYSSIVTHPLNRHDLPFLTLSGVIDSDSAVYNGNYPFFIKEGFEGIIKKGTPIFQIIPFKRENWQSQKDDSILEEGAANRFNSKAQIVGWYKQKIWKKKTFLTGPTIQKGEHK